MIGAFIVRVATFIGENFGAAICCGLMITVLGLFVAVALVRGGK